MSGQGPYDVSTTTCRDCAHNTGCSSSTKLALYASMQTNIDEHKQVLSEREKTLKEARESLVREGGAVVGSMPVLAAPAEKVEVCGI